MSLGLESSGFKRVLANEISPMAAETFAYNLVRGARTVPKLAPDSPASWVPYFTFLDPPKESSRSLPIEKLFRDWRGHAKLGQPVSKEAEAAAMGEACSDLLVGDARRLVGLLEKLKSDHPKRFQRRFGGVDILAGGPPCQSFSLAGRRQKDHPRNRLFESFVSVVKLVRPKVVLFENVLGITRPFTDEAGDEWHPWQEVCRAFKKTGYLPIPSLVNSADFGVPQSRPRFIMVAIAEEVARKVEGSKMDKGGLAEAIRRARSRYESASDDRSLIFQVERDTQTGHWPYPLFPRPTSLGDREKITVGLAIEDLIAIERNGSFVQGDYAKKLELKLKRPKGFSVSALPPNHGIRNHSPRVRARFRLLRTLAEAGFRAKSMGEVSRKCEMAVERLVNKRLFVLSSDGNYEEREKADRFEVISLIEELASAKNVQKCLDPHKPAGAQLSIPDDSIHWASDRVLTIREMARIQSFPDWFEFRSKETTGGSARSYEVPQYTQVGNAVPPLLALAFGNSIKGFLRRVSKLP